MDSGLTNEGERRANTRFPLELQLQYQIEGIAGAGTTVNISSCGVLFTAQDELTVDKPLGLSLEWPVLLDAPALQLRILGTVVRATAHQTALKVARYEFRTTQRQRTPESWPAATLERLPLPFREREIVRLVAQGYKNKEIAEKMSLSVQTVQNHLHHIFKELGTSNRLELALYAIHKGRN